MGRLLFGSRRGMGGIGGGTDGDSFGSDGTDDSFFGIDDGAGNGGRAGATEGMTGGRTTVTSREDFLGTGGGGGFPVMVAAAAAADDDSEEFAVVDGRRVRSVADGTDDPE